MKYLLAALLSAALITLFATPVRAFDEREIKMNLVLQEYRSPMVGLEQELIQLAESHGLDWTLLAAIAGTESSFGKRMPRDCINPYGWGIYAGNRLCFESFVEAAGEVSQGLSERYDTSTLTSIAKTYNKVSTSSWQAHTQFFINKIKNTNIPVSSLPITL